MLFEKLIAVVPLSRLDPELAEITEPIAQATLGCFQCLWHPAILSRGATLPVWSLASDPPLAAPGYLILVPEPSRPMLPAGWVEQARAATATVIECGASRARVMAQMKDELPTEIGRVGLVEADSFYALGLAVLYLEMLTSYMHHGSTLDQDHLQKEALAAASAAVVGDVATRDDHLRAAFQLLTEARERLYGADIHLLDLCLVDPRAGMDRLGMQLSGERPISLFATGRTVEELQRRDAATAEQLKRMLDESKADLVGGEYEEVASTLLPFESHLWQFRRGQQAYRNVLGRVPVIFGRRRFGFARHVLQLLGRMEMLYLVHFCFDDGVFPTKPDPKVRWEAPDSSTVESLARIPFSAENAAEFLRFPARLARTIASDFVATLTMVHWPMPDAPWYRDLLHMTRFANVFGKLSTLSHYFQATEPASISSSLHNDDFVSPYLAHDHLNSSINPIGQYPRRHRARAQLEQVRWMTAAVYSLGSEPIDSTADELESIESLLEQCDPEYRSQILTAEKAALDRIADLVCPPAATSQPGVLIINGLSFDRRVIVPLRSRLTDQGDASYSDSATGDTTRWSSHTVPGTGFAWIPSEPPLSSSDAATAATAEDRTIRNQFVEIEIDAVSGGIRSLRDRANRLPQLAQQLVVVGAEQGIADAPSGVGTGASVQSTKSEMRATSVSVLSPGPELACLEVVGQLVAKPGNDMDDPPLARFRQTYRLVRGQAVVRVEVSIYDIRPGALDPRANPWQSYLASRFAWPDSRSVLSRGLGTLAESTRSARPESPYFVEIHGRRQRVAILTGGLPFHQRVGQRMLDTLLITATEQERSFVFGIGVDLANPFLAALDLMTPVAMIDRPGPPRNGPAGWLFHLDARNVVITSIGPLGAGRRGVRMHVFESAGRYTRAQLRCPRNIAEARLTDFLGQRLATLDTQGDTVKLDLAPREITQLEIEFAIA
jgi:alpha-mannosidase